MTKFDEPASSAPILSIVIPTYNRTDHVRNLVELLLPQRDARWKLMVVDNHSEIPVRDVLPTDVEVIRNVANLGVAGNFPRCFELVATDWVWLLGDDDIVAPDAVERVLQMIDRYPHAAVLNFGSLGRTDTRDHPVIFIGLSEFLTGCDSVSYTIWMSGNVHSRKHYWPQLGLSYRFANTRCGHYVLLLMALAQGGSLVQLPDVVCWQTTNNDGGNHSDLVGCVMALIDLPMTNSQRKTFSQRLRERTGFSNLLRDALQCAFDMELPLDRCELLYLFSTRWIRAVIAERSPLLLMEVMVFRLMLGISLGRSILRGAVAVKNRITKSAFGRRKSVPRFYRS